MVGQFFKAVFAFLVSNWAIVVPPLLGLVAVYILLPRPRRQPILLGAAAGLAGLILAGFVIVRAGGDAITSVELLIETVLFYVFSAVAIVGAVLLVTQRNPARAALSFALVVLATCGIFLLEAAPFVMAATIIVYAGAIIVTFLFVLMLAQQEGASDADDRSREPFLASMTGFLLLIALLYILKISYKPDLEQRVKESEQRLAEIRALIEQERLHAGELELGRARVALVNRLDRFRKDYHDWLRNATSKTEKSDPLSKAPPANAERLREALKKIADQPGWRSDDRTESQNEDLINRLLKLETLAARFEELVEAGREARNNPLLGGLSPNRAVKLSDFSGPPANLPARELRLKDGKPALPAENTVYLGRSLFVDYLLQVELAGTLLLVAVIGAIAIAQRKELERSGSAAATNGTVPGRNA